MTTTGLLFFSFIILSYGIGVWVGTKIKQPKIIIKNSKDEKQYKDWKKRVSSIGPKRRR
jgi:hypothetical protein|tara:strand:+ start:274 stop:450 length:177 start_codon:yes stop_codon:yes gene_type:complete